MIRSYCGNRQTSGILGPQLAVMDPEEKQIVDYLRPCKEFVSPKVIGRQVGGKKRFAEDPNWAKPFLLRLFDQGLLEGNAMGHFRYKSPDDKRRSRKRIPLAPNILAILKASGKSFEQSEILDDDSAEEPGAAS